MNTKLSRCFLIGCDKNVEWMLPWFLSNYIRSGTSSFSDLVLADFGMNELTRKYIIDTYPFIKMINLSYLPEKGWFKKPKSMIETSKIYDEVCWIDMDIEILSDISPVFDYIEPNKLCMVEDRPWTKRRGEKWHNSGVVAFRDLPDILIKWADEVSKNPMIGDQEVLHSIIKDPLNRMIHIKDLPNEYNWLRLQIEVDKEDSNMKKTIHWTGPKGKEKIRDMLK